MRNSKLVSTTLVVSILLLVGMLVLAGNLGGTEVVLGVLAGGVLTILNFTMLGWIVRRTITQTGRPPKAGRILLAVLLKIGLLGGTLTVLVWSGRVHILGLFLGCSVVALSVMVLAPLLGVRAWIGDKQDGGN